jgi:hypothetical protein
MRGLMMDPSAIVAAALTGGVAAASAGTASAAVLGAYRELRAALVARLPGEEAVSALFDEVENHPEKANILVHQVLRSERVRIDDELYQRAKELLDILSNSGAGQGKYKIAIGGAQGIQVGDYNIQMNTFSFGEGEIS